MRIRFLLLWAILSARILCAQPFFMQPQVDSIVMSDGAKLAVDVYVRPGGVQRPTILIQTPYNRILYRFTGLPLFVDSALSSSPFHFVIADWRGFYGSTGATVAGYDRGLDGRDLCAWIASQPWSDGQVGTFGGSALGVIQFQTARHHPPALKACVPLVCDPRQLYVDYYTGGCLRREYIDALDGLGYGLSAFVIPNQIENNAWAFTEASTTWPDSIRVPTLNIAGWYDHKLEVQLEYFELLRTQSHPNVQNLHKLLIGPWTHGGFSATGPGSAQQGDLSFPNAGDMEDTLALQFLKYMLLSEPNGWDTVSRYIWYSIGPNTWHRANELPVADRTDTLWLQAGSLQPVYTDDVQTTSIAVNPNNPSPTVGGATLIDTLGQGPVNQAPLVESRGDIALFTTGQLTLPLHIKGAIRCSLRVATDRPDADVVIRLTDVYPDDRSILVWDDVQRLRFRNGNTAADTQLCTPGTFYDIQLELPPLNYRWEAGHRLRLDVSGNNWPRFDRNLQDGGPQYTNATGVAGTLTLMHDGLAPSYLLLPVSGSPLTTTAFSETEPSAATEGLRLYPNPTHGSIWIAAAAQAIGQQVVIRNSTGAVVQGFRYMGHQQYPLAPLAPGVYSVSVGGGSQRLVVW